MGKMGAHSGAHFPHFSTGWAQRLGLKPEFGGCFLGIKILPKDWIGSCSTISSGCSQMFICQYWPQCGAPKIAKLVNITPITMVYGTYNYSIHGVYKPTNITGGPHIAWYLPDFTLYVFRGLLYFNHVVRT
jgi:hypothetical protein